MGAWDMASLGEMKVVSLDVEEEGVGVETSWWVRRNGSVE